jgi:hypothetical protein
LTGKETLGAAFESPARRSIHTSIRDAMTARAKDLLPVMENDDWFEVKKTFRPYGRKGYHESMGRAFQSLLGTSVILPLKRRLAFMMLPIFLPCVSVTEQSIAEDGLIACP